MDNEGENIVVFTKSIICYVFLRDSSCVFLSKVWLNNGYGVPRRDRAPRSRRAGSRKQHLML